MNSSHEKQLAKYGGIEGYREEMKRRRGLVKTYALQGNPELAKELAKKRWQKEKADIEDAHAKEER